MKLADRPSNKKPDTPEQQQQRQREYERRKAEAEADEIAAAEQRRAKRLALRRRVDAGRASLVASGSPCAAEFASTPRRFTWKRR